jgi:hypothetical protein
LKLLKIIGTTILLTIFAVTAFATTWAPIYPYTQKTEDGKVKSHSVPYGVNDGGYGPGETFVYANGKLLYSIDKYFSNQFFTTNNGQYLIEFDFYLNYRQQDRLIDDSGKVTIEPIVYDGKAVTIYKDGKLFKTIDFKELKIDTSKIKINEFGNWFAWNYSLNDTTIDALKKKMNQHPAFIENDKLYLITADNQLIAIEVATGQITSRQNAFETLKQKLNWTPTTFKRKYKKVQYPDKFLLPELQNGKTIDQVLAEHFNKKVSDGDRDSAVIQIYFHTLLINKDGKCEIVYVSPISRSDLKKDFMYFGDEQKLKVEIEDWIKQQTFKTTTFPRGFQKFKYTDFVYLK